MDPKDKKIEELDKGVMRRLFPFNPKKDVQVDDKKDLRLWQTYGNDGYDGEIIEDPDDVRQVREGLSEINPNAKKRGLNKLMSMTQTRINPETKEREFLLHRGMSSEEYKNSIFVAGNENSIISSNKTSWMPDLESAHNYKNTNYATSGRLPKQRHGKVVSAWIKESDIHHIPKMYGAIDGNYKGHGSNEYEDENEIILKPHKSILFNRPKKNKKPQKLAASENVNKNIKRFYLNKKEKITAVGVQFLNGKCIVNWLKENASINVYNSIKEVLYQDSTTEINFMEDLNKSEKQKKLEKAYEKFKARTKYLRKHPENKLPFMFLGKKIK